MSAQKSVVLADRVLQIAPSSTLAINAKAKQLRAAGVDVLNFSVGEPDFPTPAHVCEAGKKAIDDGHTRYTAANGILELREAVCARYMEKQGLIYDPDQVQISCGGKHGLYNVFQALLNPGDEVLIPAPYWVSYPPMVELAGGVPVLVPLLEENNFDLDAEALRRAASDKTKALILNSPSNPTGSVYSAEALAKVAALALERGWLVLSDDMYEEIYYSKETLPHILAVEPALQEQCLLANGVSKAYSMTGWRIGWCAGPLHLIKAMNKIQSQSTSNPAAPSQYAALAAITGPQDSTKMMVEAFISRRNYFAKALNELPGVHCVEPTGAFYVFPNFSAYYGKKFQDKVIDNSIELANYFLDEAKVATVPGAAFGADEFIRFSFATSMENIEKGMRRIGEALSRLEK